jgi:hypothetical protein
MKAIRTKKITKEFDFRTIKSFEDACKKENIDPAALSYVSMLPEEFRKALIAVYKLFIIYKAINNGWIANFGDINQTKYFPWYRILPSGSGFDFSYAFYTCDDSGTNVGVRLCFETREKCEYVAKQFTPLYEAYLLTK